MKKNTIVHDALVLAAFSCVLGLILGGVYMLTKPAIDEANLRKEQAAYFEVFKDAYIFEKAEYNQDDANASMTAAGYKDTIDDVHAAKDQDGNILGYVVTVTAKDGSQGAITLSVGVKNDGTVNGYSILAHSETPGLGAKATEENFISQFRDKKVDKFIVVKSSASADNEIEAITGSTITSEAVANACNAAMLFVSSYGNTDTTVGGAK
jgi:electron transport complex protein RnfG